MPVSSSVGPAVAAKIVPKIDPRMVAKYMYADKASMPATAGPKGMVKYDGEES